MLEHGIEGSVEATLRDWPNQAQASPEPVWDERCRTKRPAGAIKRMPIFPFLSSGGPCASKPEVGKEPGRRQDGGRHETKRFVISPDGGLPDSRVVGKARLGGLYSMET